MKNLIALACLSLSFAFVSGAHAQTVRKLKLKKTKKVAFVHAKATSEIKAQNVDKFRWRGDVITIEKRQVLVSPKVKAHRAKDQNVNILERRNYPLGVVRKPK